MAVERTLSIIKPDAVAKNVIGKIYSRFETNGLQDRRGPDARLSREEAEGFYAVHRERPFFKDLVEFMISGPVMIQVLEGENAIAKNRDLMGATDPKKAAKGTIRADFAESIDANAVHGSDGPDTAQAEIAYFFPALAVHAADGAAPTLPTGCLRHDQPARPRRRRLAALLRRTAARSRSARGRCCAGCTAAASTTSAR